MALTTCVSVVKCKQFLFFHIETKLERLSQVNLICLAWDKHSSLFCPAINEREKKFFFNNFQLAGNRSLRRLQEQAVPHCSGTAFISIL
jgi:hypothetical protein